MANGSSEQRRVSRQFTVFGFILRLVGVLALVAATYNPTEYSYYRWVSDAIRDGNLGAVHVFFGVLLIIGWTILLVATRSSLGSLGVVLGAALLGTAVWLLIDLGVLHPDSVTAMTWIALFCLAFLLAVGLSWSHIWRRLTGQVDITDDDQ
jgi:uncharacterized membrane protein